MQNKLPISIGILAWNSGQVLVDTLTTYYENGLFNMVNDITILFQEVTKEEYEDLLSKMPRSIRLEDLSFYETEDGTSTNATLACSSDGNCELVDISA
jgi:hypothetical protein